MQMMVVLLTKVALTWMPLNRQLNALVFMKPSPVMIMGIVAPLRSEAGLLARIKGGSTNLYIPALILDRPTAPTPRPTVADRWGLVMQIRVVV